MRQRSGMSMTVLALLLPLATGAAENAAAQPKAALPADFLEYLAALEGTDDNWTDFVVDREQPPLKDSQPAATNTAKAKQPK